MLQDYDKSSHNLPAMLPGNHIRNSKERIRSRFIQLTRIGFPADYVLGAGESGRGMNRSIVLPSLEKVLIGPQPRGEASGVSNMHSQFLVRSWWLGWSKWTFILDYSWNEDMDSINKNKKTNERERRCDDARRIIRGELTGILLGNSSLRGQYSRC